MAYWEPEQQQQQAPPLTAVVHRYERADAQAERVETGRADQPLMSQPQELRHRSTDFRFSPPVLPVPATSRESMTDLKRTLTLVGVAVGVALLFGVCFAVSALWLARRGDVVAAPRAPATPAAAPRMLSVTTTEFGGGTEVAATFDVQLGRDYQRRKIASVPWKRAGLPSITQMVCVANASGGYYVPAAQGAAVDCGVTRYETFREADGAHIAVYATSEGSDCDDAGGIAFCMLLLRR